MSRSSRGLGRQPFTLLTSVRIRYGTPYSNAQMLRPSRCSGLQPDIFLVGRFNSCECVSIRIISTIRGISSIGRAQHCHCWGKGIETPISRQFICGCSSAGRAPRCQRDCRRFNPDHPLHFHPSKIVRIASLGGHYSLYCSVSIVGS